MAKTSPTQRTLKRMRESGDYKLVQVVEKWNPFARIRQDLWNFDILGISITGETHAIQVTSYSNMNARIKKDRRGRSYTSLKRCRLGSTCGRLEERKKWSL